VDETLLLTLCNWSLAGAKRAQSPFCVGFSSILLGQVAAAMVQGTACRGAAAGQLNHDVTHLQGQRIEGALAQVRGV
jgi:hypothetical protein